MRIAKDSQRETLVFDLYYIIPTRNNYGVIIVIVGTFSERFYNHCNEKINNYRYRY